MRSGMIKTALRVFDILEYIRDRDGVTLSEVAAEVGMARSTAHGYLTTLEELGYLVREDGQFYLGLTFLQLGRVAKERLGYLEIIEPTLEKVAEQTGEAVWFVAEEGGRAIYLMEKEGSNAARTTGAIGNQAPLHATAAGKVILSGQPEKRIDELILEEYTEETITDRDVLREEISQVRKTGIAHNNHEKLVGLRAVACPIRVGERIIGAISVGGPAERIRDEKFEENLPIYLSGVANEIELNLSELNFQ